MRLLGDGFYVRNCEVHSLGCENSNTGEFQYTESLLVVFIILYVVEARHVCYDCDCLIVRQRKSEVKGFFWSH